MKKTNKLFALILAIVMIVSLAACSNHNSKAAQQLFASVIAENPFSEGLAWTGSMGGATVISDTGKVVYQSSNKLDRSVPFKDGVSYYRSDKDYYIVDKNGKVTYQTPPYDSTHYEQILAYGNGEFLMYRYSDEFGSDSKGSVGTVDKNGKEKSRFVSVSRVNSKDSRYLGDGVFLINSGTTFDTTDGEVKSCPGKSFGDVSENGKIWIEVNEYSMGIYDLHTAEYTKIEGHSGKNHSFVNATGIYDESYYNLNGEEIANIQLYKDKVIARSEFTKDGFSPLVLSDGGTYFTYVNLAGEEQFKPISFSGRYSIHGDLIAIGNSDSGIVTIYDHTGQEKYHVENVTEIDDLELYEDYFITGSAEKYTRRYYFFR